MLIFEIVIFWITVHSYVQHGQLCAACGSKSRCCFASRFLDNLASHSAFALSSFVSVTWLYLEHRMVLVSRGKLDRMLVFLTCKFRCFQATLVMQAL